MGKWKSSKNFIGWLNLAPNTKITGGKIISSKMQKKEKLCWSNLSYVSKQFEKMQNFPG
jgi:hypothetical protein